jgi:hypothetical protein
MNPADSLSLDFGKLAEYFGQRQDTKKRTWQDRIAFYVYQSRTQSSGTACKPHEPSTSTTPKSSVYEPFSEYLALFQSSNTSESWIFNTTCGNHVPSLVLASGCYIKPSRYNLANLPLFKIKPTIGQQKVTRIHKVNYHALRGLISWDWPSLAQLASICCRERFKVYKLRFPSACFGRIAWTRTDFWYIFELNICATC